MALITLRDVSWGLGGAPLIEKVSFQIEAGERVCLLGRNGVGKSTLLNILDGKLPPDSGDIWRQQGVTVAALEQEVPKGIDGTIFEVAAGGLGAAGRALAEHRRLCAASQSEAAAGISDRLEELHQQLDADDGWALSQQIEQVLSRSDLDPDRMFGDLSAGMKRRVLFCRAMALEPDLLLLDEPTNHLDIDTIVWLEAFVLRHVKTLLFVSHDQAFVQRIANRILDLDRGRLTSYACDYPTYLKRRTADDLSEAKQEQRFDKKLSREETWIRQGIKARRTRNEGRVRALKKMRRAFRERRRKMGTVRMAVQDAERTGKVVVEARAIDYAYDRTPYVKDFSTVIMRGDKIGIIGPNGVGKTTLLKILLKEIEPDQGSVRHGTKLQVAYFDQLRNQLDEEKTVAENIGEGNDHIVFNGCKRHIVSYLRDFLFSPDRCRTPVHILSGGEKNRLLLAKLFTKPANVVVMDEPTNDLDAETLELLEELLLEYTGTLLLVSHDRSFLNNVVTGTLAFEGHGVVRAYPGGYDDWLIQRPKPESPQTEIKQNTKSPKNESFKTDKPRKLSYMEQRELDSLPKRIEELEAEQHNLFETVSDPDFFRKEPAEMTAVQTRLQQLEVEIADAYGRWETLEANCQ